MFYHDHAWGITRLNVLVGQAAGLLVTDQTEQTLIEEGILPDIGIPLVIQDRTFVEADRVRLTDPTWNWGSGPVDAGGVRTPVTGDFWMPHVYIVAQNPYCGVRHERLRPLGVRPLVLPAHREPLLPAGGEPLPRPELQRPGSGGARLLHHAEPAARHPGHAAAVGGRRDLLRHPDGERAGLPVPERGAEGLPVPHPERVRTTAS